MSYVEELKSKIEKELAEKGVRVQMRGSSGLQLLRGGEVVMTIVDRGEHVELSYKGKTYKYDKWYTKPEHLAKVILGQF